MPVQFTGVSCRGIRRRAALAACGVLLVCLGLPGPGSAQFPNDGTGVTGIPESPSCRSSYDGPQPTLVRPPAYIVDVALPSIYCGNINKWVFIYPTRAGVQLYQLNPDKRESYRVMFTAASKGEIAPWAVETALPGGAAYLVNANPDEDTIYDYTVSPGAFDACAELAVLRTLKISSGEPRVHCTPDRG